MVLSKCGTFSTCAQPAYMYSLCVTMDSKQGVTGVTIHGKTVPSQSNAFCNCPELAPDVKS